MGDIGVDGILGCDFLVEHGCHLDMGQRKLMVGSVTVACSEVKGDDPRVNRVTMTETVNISPGQEIMLQGQLAFQVDPSKSVIVEPTSKFVEKHSVLVAKTVTTLPMERFG